MRWNQPLVTHVRPHHVPFFDWVLFGWLIQESRPHRASATRTSFLFSSSVTARRTGANVANTGSALSPPNPLRSSVELALAEIDCRRHPGLPPPILRWSVPILNVGLKGGSGQAGVRLGHPLLLHLHERVPIDQVVNHFACYDEPDSEWDRWTREQQCWPDDEMVAPSSFSAYSRPLGPLVDREAERRRCDGDPIRHWFDRAYPPLQDASERVRTLEDLWDARSPTRCRRVVGVTALRIERSR